MAKVKTQKWHELDFLINNFYEILEFKRGRGIYGDRVVFKRNVDAEKILVEPGKIDFYYMDANPVKEIPITIKNKLDNVIRFVTSPEHMNVICQFNPNVNPVDWAIETRRKFAEVKITDENLFEKLNTILEERYKLLDANFLSRLEKHKQMQYFIAKEMELVDGEFATEQISL